MLQTIFAPKSISNKCSTAEAPITSNTATVGESGVLFQTYGRDSVVLLDRVSMIEKGKFDKFFGKLGDEKALAVATPSNSRFMPENFTLEPLPPLNSIRGQKIGGTCSVAGPEGFSNNSSLDGGVYQNARFQPLPLTLKTLRLTPRKS